MTVGVEPGEGGVEFRVTDRGRDVPAAFRRAIFERFRQVEASDAREMGGTGLGLAICRSIIDQHGGMIGVESEVGGPAPLAPARGLFLRRVQRPPRAVA